MLFIAQWLQIRGMGWTGSCQKKPKRNRRVIQFIFTDVRFYDGESPQYMTICWGNLQSLSSLIAKIPWPRASGVQWGDHNRAFPCWSNPINCFPSSCSESVESDGEEGGEECVLSRCPTSNLSALKGWGPPGSRWLTGGPGKTYYQPQDHSPLWNRRGRSWKLGPRWSLAPLWSSDLSLACPSSPHELALLYGGIPTNSQSHCSEHFAPFICRGILLKGKDTWKYVHGKYL